MVDYCVVLSLKHCTGWQVVMFNNSGPLECQKFGCDIPMSQLKPSQNKKGQKNLQLHCFLNTFYIWQLRKSIQKCFDPSYSVTALELIL